MSIGQKFSIFFNQCSFFTMLQSVIKIDRSCWPLTPLVETPLAPLTTFKPRSPKSYGILSTQDGCLISHLLGFPPTSESNNAMYWSVWVCTHLPPDGQPQIYLIYFVLSKHSHLAWASHCQSLRRYLLSSSHTVCLLSDTYLEHSHLGTLRMFVMYW